MLPPGGTDRANLSYRTRSEVRDATEWDISVTEPVKFPDYRCAAVIGATLDGMGYRGEDSARDRAAWGTQSPRQSSSGQWPVSDESWSSASRGHETRGYDENSTEHAGYDGNRHAGGSGYPADDNYAGYDGYGPGRD